MPKLLNLDLMREPLNWIIVFLMCAFALIALGMIFPQGSE
jgi:hypothetical protein